MIEVPFFRQTTEYSCGPAVLRMVFSFYGLDLSEKELIKKLKTSKKTGTKNEMIVKVAESKGFDVYVNNESSVEEVASFVTKNIPVIVNLVGPDDNEGHFVVIKDVASDTITYADPSDGDSQKIKVIDFEKRWRSGYENYGKRVTIVGRRP